MFVVPNNTTTDLVVNFKTNVWYKDMKTDLVTHTTIIQARPALRAFTPQQVLRDMCII